MPGILVVDDLPVIRTGITHLLTQHQVALQPYLEAADGAEAVQMARRYKPDIILMDIKMPNLDGLQATSLIRAEQQDVKIVMLTAYNEFSYIQKALKLGARDYLLKPIRPAKLIELLDDIQKELYVERRNQRTIEMVKDSLQKTLPVIEANLVENLIRGTNPDGATPEESLAFLGKRLSHPAALVAKIDDYENASQGLSAAQLQKLYLSLVDIVRQALPEPQHALVGYSKPGRVIVILSCDKQPSTPEQLSQLAEKIRQAIQTETSFTVTIGIGNMCSDWEALPLSYAEANLARRYQSHLGANAVIHISQVLASKLDRNDETSYRIQHEQDLLNSLQNGDQERVMNLANEIVDYLAQQFSANPEGLRNGCAELVALVAWAVIGSGIDQRTVLELSHTQIMSLNSHKNLQDVRTWTMNCLAELMATMQVRTHKKNAISQAIEYLQANYQRADISLQEVADAVFLSQSYLASQFKDTLGVSYMRYLTALRIEEAKRLLRNTDLSIVAIAEKVGYPNVTNFYRHFQRLQGKTPAAYRQTETGVPPQLTWNNSETLS
jgi:two-component system, response regulator YesN